MAAEQLIEVENAAAAEQQNGADARARLEAAITQLGAMHLRPDFVDNAFSRKREDRLRAQIEDARAELDHLRPVEEAGAAVEPVKEAKNVAADPTAIVLARGWAMFMPAAYREHVEQRHELMDAVISKRIDEEVLPEEYRLPRLAEFAGRVLELRNVYGFMANEGVEPDVVYVPQGLPLDTWNSLLTGYVTVDFTPSLGITQGWGNTSGNLTDHAGMRKLKAGSEWDVAVMSAAPRPSFLDVSPNGLSGNNAGRAREWLRKLADIIDPDRVEMLIPWLTPSIDAYLALQLTRLADGKQMVDIGTRSITKESLVSCDKGILPVYLGSGAPDGKWVEATIGDSPGQARKNSGVRPAVAARNLVPEVSDDNEPRLS